MKLLKISLLCFSLFFFSSAFCTDRFSKFLDDELFYIQSDIEIIANDDKNEETTKYIYLLGKKNMLQEIKYNYRLFMDGQFPENDAWPY
ncbi:MAG TPA: hypothetical protein VMX17_09480 [Candidatus Glassbacteria bacterium]|jgi:hypothetical protein|nr:hypothetical protein [Candidatus Glassbacteria bacterium]